ncbi:A24 family peptidase [Ferrimonas pelagia]|uniref:Prepilin peptidase n=1 Tax=Ferrimonas pelagia TaxID=1177826 RepID=A0ABP9FI89_9GAMM
MYAYLALLLVIAMTDVVARTIPNRSVLLLLLVLLMVFGLPTGQACLQAMGCLLLGLLLFRYRVIGGGDVKLLTVIALFIAAPYFTLTLLLMVWAGGIVAGLCWLACMIQQRPRAYTVPYAVPICLAGTFGLLASG